MCLKRIFKKEEPDPIPTVPPPPVEPTPTLPTYKRWSVAGHYLIKKLEKMGMKTFLLENSFDTHFLSSLISK